MGQCPTNALKAFRENVFESDSSRHLNIVAQTRDDEYNQDGDFQQERHQEVQERAVQEMATERWKTPWLIQGDFFNWASPENVSRLAPPKFAWTGPCPNFSKCWNHIHFARHLGVFRSEGGPVWDSNVFLKSVTYRPTLSKFRGGPVKKTTLYDAGLKSTNVFIEFIQSKSEKYTQTLLNTRCGKSNLCKAIPSVIFKWPLQILRVMWNAGYK